MNVSYGSPGHRGVTHLMAVGAAELEEGAADHAVKLGLVGSVAVVVVGHLANSRTARNVGMGGVIALLVVRHLAGSHGRVVQVTAPAATPAGEWWAA